MHKKVKLNHKVVDWEQLLIDAHRRVGRIDGFRKQLDRWGFERDYQGQCWIDLRFDDPWDSPMLDGSTIIAEQVFGVCDFDALVKRLSAEVEPPDCDRPLIVEDKK